jgi:Protein of unknown function (DUF732)
VPATVDAAYLAQVRRLDLGHGADSWPDAKLIAAGHGICDVFAAKLPASLIKQDATDEGIPLVTALALMFAATDRYCPAFADEVTS